MAAPALPASVATALPNMQAAVNALHNGNTDAGTATAVALAELATTVQRLNVNMATLAADNVQAHDRIDADAIELRRRHDTLQGLHDVLRAQHDALEVPLNRLTAAVGEVVAEGSAMAGGASAA